MTAVPDKFRSAFNSCKSSPIISAIRFPEFKALEPDLRIEFTYPVTALVGQNGSNKSSILHALYCAPEGKSMSDMWFSTQLDPIDSKITKHRFIYEYPVRSGNLSAVAEVRKSRVSKRFRNEWIPQALQGKYDPDYWEPTKRVEIDGMRPIPEDPAFDPYLSGTRDRWRAIRKNVVYIDFREELSAYDKFIHHTASDRWTKNSTERRYRVITRTPELVTVFGTMRRTSDRTESPRSLSPADTNQIANILGKDFSEIKIVKHRCFGVEGYSAQMTIGANRYSEAHAGSGEFAVIRLVDEISQAPDSSMILLDEPEVSLHPGAQIALMDYILQTCLRHGHQVVLSTHSPTIVEKLPPDAVKLLGTNGKSQTVRLLSQHTLPPNAFFNLGYVTNRPGKRVIVEDVLVEEIVKTACRVFNPDALALVKPITFPGGADRIVRSVIPTLTTSDVDGTAVLLDGDQVPGLQIGEAYPYTGSVPNVKSEIEQLSTDARTESEAEAGVQKWRSIVRNQFGPGTEFDIHSRSKEKMTSDIREMKEIQRNLEWSIRNVRYLAGRVPEAALLHELGLLPDPLTSSAAAKEMMVRITKDDLNKSDLESVSAAEILDTEKRMLADLAKRHKTKSALLKSAYSAVEVALRS